MKLDQCKRCPHFLSLMDTNVLCAHGNNITERHLAQKDTRMYVENCPLKNNTSFTGRELHNEPMRCNICQGKGIFLYNEKEEACPLCNGQGNLHEDADKDDGVLLPHLAEFRVKAIRMGERYKVVMTTRKNSTLVTSSRIVDTDDPLYNAIFFACKGMLQ